MANDLFTKIVAGEVQLLTADQVCKRLGVSRTTFDRWCRNHVRPEEVLSQLAKGTNRTLADVNSLHDSMANLADGHIAFPRPDVRIGRSPRWTFETVVNWLEKNSTN